MKRAYLLYIILSFLMCPCVVFAGNYVIINQVMYDTPLNEKTNVSPASNGEYIELYNAGTSSVSLEGWRLTGDGTSEIVTFTQGITIDSGSYLIVACRRGANNTFQLSDLYTLPGISNYSIIYQNKILLVNNGETLTLYNAQNDTVDQLYYDGTSHLSNPNRLYATNADSIPGDSCVSIHRTGVEFDSDGLSIPGTSEWKSARVSFGSTMLPYTSYHENYIMGEHSLPEGENYILSITPLDPTTRIDIKNGAPAVSSGIRVHTNIEYLDGLGRQTEVISIGCTPDKHDLVSVFDYHGKSKLSRQWLPVIMDSDGQRIANEEVTSLARSDYDDSRPFVETLYENSARKRPLMQIRPGSGYAGHGATQSYNYNSADDQVLIYTVSSIGALKTDGMFYDTSTLYKTVASDEDGKTVTTYTDKQGRKIMEERHTSRTYYVYDELGRLRFILPNLPSSKLNNGVYPINNQTIKALAYCYQYDGRGNVIYKRLPGCEAQLMVYDRENQLVLKQDGNQRPSGKWILCAYDSIGRNLYEAEICLSQTHESLISLYEDKWQVEHFGTNQTNSIPYTGYASTILGTNLLRLLVVNYYDNYDFIQLLSPADRQALSFVQTSGYGQRYDNCIGLMTGSRIYNLTEEGYTATALYYDIYGHVIQNRSNRNAGGYITTDTEYLFDGSVAKQSITQGTDSDAVRESYRYTYDHAGRELNTYYKLNNQPEIVLSSLLYDSLGHLAQKLLMNNRDTIKYAYDMRNMLTEIRNKHFSERLFYADGLSGTTLQNASACYNGNIAATVFETNMSSHAFSYSYDQLNRLTASYSLSNNGALMNERFAYDQAGNIQVLQRFGNNHLIDDLRYSYTEEGHQLLSVTDNGVDEDQYDVIEYHDLDIPIPVNPTMGYDANGNLIYDRDRNISVIKYNVLNLPDTIQFVNGNQIVNHYDAAGRKYKAICYTNIATVITPHYNISHYSLETDSIEYLITEHAGNIENSYTKNGSTRRIHNTVGYYANNAFYHYIKDHLGNVSAVVRSIDNVVFQYTLYYASGVPMSQSEGRELQPYLYNGKEFVEAHGWNTYDYGFRGYYAPIGRFTSIDPLAESTPWQSPYAYAGNNFINNIDWMGLSGMYSYSSGWMSSYFIASSRGGLGSFDDVLNYIIVDEDGIVLDADLTSPDKGIYEVKRTAFEKYCRDYPTGDHLLWAQLFGTQVGFHNNNINPHDLYYDIKWSMSINGSYYDFERTGSILWIPQVSCHGSTTNDRHISLMDAIFTLYNARNEYLCNDYRWKGKNNHWYNSSQRNNNFVNRSYKLAYEITHSAPFPVAVLLFQGIEIAADMRFNGLNWGNLSNAIFLGIGCSSTFGFCAALAWTLGDWAYGWYSGTTTTEVLSRYRIRF